MRLSFALVLLLPSFTFAQTKEMVDAIERKLANAATAKWVFAQEAPDGGFYLAPQDPNVDAMPRASLRATNGAVKALHYLGHPLLNKEKEKHAKFVLSCYDPKTGGFAEMPGGKNSISMTAVGVMAAAELGIPHTKYAKAMDYLKVNAKTFEEVRIGAAAVEAWGVMDCPFDVKPFIRRGIELGAKGSSDQLQQRDGGARDFGSTVAIPLRLGAPMGEAERDHCAALLKIGQRDDGGWGKKGEKASDIESTYRVMRALMLMQEEPNDAKKLRAFLAAHRNNDGGYATKPGEKSSMSGVYYCTIIAKWLDDLAAKK